MRNPLRRLPALHHLLWVFPFLLFAPTLLSGQALVWGTPSLQFIPWRFLAWEQIQAGIWPFWNPLNGMGAPLLANYQLALYYPPGWLLFGLQAIGGAPWMAWGYTLLLVLHLAWVGYGMAYLVKRLGHGELAQVVAGLAFSLSGYLVARAGFFSMIWSAAWLPWLVLCIERLLEAQNARQRLARLAGLALCIGLQLLSGHAQITWYSLIFAGCWALLAGWNRRGNSGALSAGGLFLAAGLLGACLAAVQLIPTFELLMQSQRAAAVIYDTAMTYSFWPWRFITLFMPSFFGNPAYGDYWGYASYWEDAIYIGLLPCLMALSTMRKCWRAEKNGLRGRIRLLWGFTLVGALLALGKNTPVFPFLYEHVPTFDMFQAPARYMLWPVFSLSLLAAVGIDSWPRPLGQALRRLRRTIFAILAGLAGAVVAFFVLPGIQASFIYSLALAGVLGLVIAWLALKKPLDPDSPRQLRWNWLVAVFVGVDLLVAGGGQNPATSSQFYATDGGSGDSVIAKPTGRLYLDDPSEYQLKFGRFLRFEDYRPQESWENLRRAQIPNLNILNGVASANNFDPLRPARYDEWMIYLSSLSTEEHIAWLQKMGVSLLQTLTSPTETDYSFQRLNGGERFTFSSCALYADGMDDAWNKTVAVVGGGQNVVVIETDAPKTILCGEETDVRISILSDKATRIELEVEAGQDGWLSMADTWYPGWRATLDGESVELARADFVFRGVFIESGRHNLIIDYRPAWLKLSIGISLLGVLAIMVFWFLGKKIQSHRLEFQWTFRSLRSNRTRTRSSRTLKK